MSDFQQQFLNAAVCGDTARMQELLQEGVDVNCRDEHRRTAVMLAMQGGHLETLKWLIEVHADTALYDDEGGTVLDYAPRHFAPAHLEEQLRQCREYLLTQWRETYLRRRPIPALIARDFLEAYSHVDGHAAFRLKNGDVYEGYFSIEGDFVKFVEAFSPLDWNWETEPEPELIPIADIDIDSLYW